MSMRPLRTIHFRYTFWAFHSQLKAYKKRKKLLFRRMKFGTIGMCIMIIFLSWLQQWLPKKNRQFWSSEAMSLESVCNISFNWLMRLANFVQCLFFNLIVRTSLRSRLCIYKAGMHRHRWVQRISRILRGKLTLHKRSRKLHMWLSSRLWHCCDQWLGADEENPCLSRYQRV